MKLGVGKIPIPQKFEVMQPLYGCYMYTSFADP